MRKGIILAGGTGSRLYPLTFSITKQLLPVHDKPMIFYPLSTLLQLGLKEVLIISTEKDMPLFQNLFGNGSRFGISIDYRIQERPNGIAEGFIIAEDFLDQKPCVFILGDNLFIGSMDQKKFTNEYLRDNGATIFTYKVNDPQRYGVVNVDKNNNPIDIIEKPKNPKSDNAVTGLYFYDSSVAHIAKSLTPSNRGELEITDINKMYLKKNTLFVKSLDNDMTWLDAGTIKSLYEASNFIRALEERTGKKIGCLEEIALSKKLISKGYLKKIIPTFGSSEYGKYLKQVYEKKL